MYKTSSQLKREAKEALKGRWKDAVFLNIVPSILNILAIWGVTLLFIVGLIGAFFLMNNTEFSNSGVRYEERGDYLDEIFDEEDFDGYSLINDPDLKKTINVSPGNFIMRSLFTIVLSFMTIGISFTFIEVLRNPMRKISPSNDQFRMFNSNDFVPLVLIQILSSLFVYFWTMLFLIPGIIKSYAYSQSFYIYKDLSEHTDTQSLSANNYITESKLLMNGHKGRLFYIDLSFLGWHLLSLVTLGIGYLFLNPYINATKAAFYLDVSKNRYVAGGNADQPLSETIEVEDEWTSF